MSSWTTHWQIHLWLLRDADKSLLTQRTEQYLKTLYCSTFQPFDNFQSQYFRICSEKVIIFHQRNNHFDQMGNVKNDKMHVFYTIFLPLWRIIFKFLHIHTIYQYIILNSNIFAKKHFCIGYCCSDVWGLWDFFYVSERSLLCSPRLHLFDKNTVKTVILWIIIIIIIIITI